MPIPHTETADVKVGNDAQLFANDREKLPTALGYDLSKHSAHVPEINPEQTIAPQQEIAKGPQQDRSIGVGIGF